MKFSNDQIYVEFGGLKRRVGPIWFPASLDLWWGNRGIHFWWDAWPPAMGRSELPEIRETP